jgi:tetratricopeptide (TPR) repeat protein
VLGAILVGAVFTVYLPLFHAGFIWDDDAFLTNNPLIKAGDGLYRFWCTTEPPDYFPLTSSVLWLEWRIWGDRPLGYHLVNIALHAASSVLLWRILARLKVPGGWLAACLFAVHPVNVESVAWITELKNTLAMFLYLAAVLGFLQFDDSRRYGWFGFSLAMYALALLSKTAVVMLPVVLLGIAWWRRGKIGGNDLRIALPYFALSLLFGLITVWFQAHRAMGGEVVRDDGLAARIAGAAWAVWFYAYKLCWPLDLMFVYPRWSINPTTIVAWLPLAALATLFLVARRGRKGWGTPVIFGLGYFVVSLLPVLGFADIYFMRFSFVSDHWQYFAMIGPVALAASALTRIAKPAWFCSACAVVLLATLGGLSWSQTRVFTNSLTLWTAAVARNPGSALAQYNLGCTLLNLGNTRLAKEHFESAVALKPDLADAQNNLGNLLLRQGHAREAVGHFEAALRSRPFFADAHNNLGGAFLELGQVAEAAAQFQRALEINPRDAAGHYNLGSALLRSGRLSEAVAQLSEAVVMDPGFVAAYRKLGSASLQAGNPAAAVAYWETALSLNPGLAGVRSDLGTVLLERGDAAEALRQYEQAVQLQPTNALFLNNLAWLLATCSESGLRDGQRALNTALAANRLMAGRNADVLGTLAAAYAENGLFTNAIQTAEAALSAAQSRSNFVQARLLRQNLDLYRAGRPVREPVSTNRSGSNPN